MVTNLAGDTNSSVAVNDDCPFAQTADPEKTARWEALRVSAMVIFAALAVYVAATSAVYVVYRNDFPLRVRNHFLVLLSGVSLLSICATSHIVLIVGVLSFPCRIRFWLSVIAVTMNGTPLLLRAVLLNFRYRWAHEIQALSVEGTNFDAAAINRMTQSKRCCERWCAAGIVLGVAVVVSAVTLPVYLTNLPLHSYQKCGDVGCGWKLVQYVGQLGLMIILATGVGVSMCCVRREGRDVYGIKRELLLLSMTWSAGVVAFGGVLIAVFDDSSSGVVEHIATNILVLAAFGAQTLQIAIPAARACTHKAKQRSGSGGATSAAGSRATNRYQSDPGSSGHISSTGSAAGTFRSKSSAPSDPKKWRMRNFASSDPGKKGKDSRGAGKKRWPPLRVLQRNARGSRYSDESGSQEEGEGGGAAEDDQLRMLPPPADKKTRLLREMLASARLRAALEQHLVKEFATENLTFLSAAEEWRHSLLDEQRLRARGTEDEPGISEQERLARTVTWSDNPMREKKRQTGADTPRQGGEGEAVDVVPELEVATAPRPSAAAREHSPAKPKPAGKKWSRSGTLGFTIFPGKTGSTHALDAKGTDDDGGGDEHAHVTKTPATANASQIYSVFISENGPLQVNISSSQRRQISAKLDKAQSLRTNPPHDLFLPAYLEVEQLLAADALSRFLKTEAYHKEIEFLRGVEEIQRKLGGAMGTTSFIRTDRISDPESRANKIAGRIRLSTSKAFWKSLAGGSGRSSKSGAGKDVVGSGPRASTAGAPAPTTPPTDAATRVEPDGPQRPAAQEDKGGHKSSPHHGDGGSGAAKMPAKSERGTTTTDHSLSMCDIVSSLPGRSSASLDVSGVEMSPTPSCRNKIISR